MVGGKVIEVADIKSRPNVIWVNCADMPRGRRKPDTCSVLVERSPDADKIEIGDSIWWQGGRIYWTPQDKSRVEVVLRKIGGSGVTYETACGPGD